MSGLRWRGCALAAMGVAAVFPARASVDDAAERWRRIVALERDVAELSGQESWLTAARAEEIRGLVEDVLADADARASLRSSGAVAGYDNGFFLASADGRFRLNVMGQVQVRWVYSHQDDGPDDDDRAGFENTRTRFAFSGHVVDPSWKYFIWGGWTGSGASILLDAWIEKQFAEAWSVRAGQFKLPVWREWTLSETRQQLVERSVLDARYAQVCSQGVMLCLTGEVLRLHGAFSDGLRTRDTAWSVGPDVTTGALPYPQSNEYAFTARAEWKLAGAWSQYVDLTSFPGEEPMVVLGAAAHYQRGEYGTPDDEMRILQWTADGSLEFGGANLYAAVIGTDVKDGGVDRHEIGVLVQGGVFVANDWEVVARCAYGDNDGAGALEDTISVVTLGLNRYVRRHALKWTTDFGYAFDPIDASWSTTSRGYRPDGPGRDGQVVVRTQMQVLF